MDFSDSKDGDEATRKNNPLYRRIGNIHGVDPEGQCSDEERPCVELTWGEADVLWGHIEISREG